jgi:hypothetical protein
MVRTITLPSIFKITQLQFKIHTIRNCCTDGIRKALIDRQPNGSRGTHCQSHRHTAGLWGQPKPAWLDRRDNTQTCTCVCSSAHSPTDPKAVSWYAHSSTGDMHKLVSMQRPTAEAPRRSYCPQIAEKPECAASAKQFTPHWHALPPACPMGDSACIPALSCMPCLQAPCDDNAWCVCQEG